MRAHGYPCQGIQLLDPLICLTDAPWSEYTRPAPDSGPGHDVAFGGPDSLVPIRLEQSFPCLYDTGISIELDKIHMICNSPF